MGKGGGKSSVPQQTYTAPAETTQTTVAPEPEEGMTDEQKAARKKQLAASADASGRSGTLFGGSDTDALGTPATSKTVLGG